MAYIYAPIYKDTYYTTTASSLNYTIVDNRDNNVIFSGRAVRMPNQEEIRININKVCQDYLWQNMSTIFDGATTEEHPYASGMFLLKNADSNATINNYIFFHCYDYDFNWTGNTGVTLSQPICRVYGQGMRRLNTRIMSSHVVSTTASTPDFFNDCVDYGLYYVNARGGWDAFAIQGTAKKKDAITQYTMDKAFNNNTREWENMRYISEVKTSYELNTHYLTDEESANLAKNLLGSNMVYLHNLTDGTIKPVVITDTAVSYQTYQTNGKKMAQYKINVVESQSKIRR